jgi:hypothetical protein
LSKVENKISVETRFNRTAWLAVLASVLIFLASLMARFIGFHLPSDGWELVESPTGELIFLRNYLAVNGGARHARRSWLAARGYASSCGRPAG